MPRTYCIGSLQLHRYPLREGLQSYLVLDCERCHSIVASFPTSLHLDESASEAVNNPKMMSHRSNEINLSATLALHTTSFSWHDFRLVSRYWISRYRRRTSLSFQWEDLLKLPLKCLSLLWILPLETCAIE